MAIILLSFSNAFAQRAKGDVGIRGQWGQPSGLPVKIYNPNSLSIDILAAWDLEDLCFKTIQTNPSRLLLNTAGLKAF